MAFDMFLVITGPDMKGESTDRWFPDAIDILSWSSAVSQPASFAFGSGGGIGKSKFQDLSFTHYLDAASMPLQLACASGTHIKKAVLTVRKAGKMPMTYLTTVLDKVMVTSVVSGTPQDGDRLTETFTLCFAKITSTYFVQDSKTGAVKPGSPTYVWDVAANSAN